MSDSEQVVFSNFDDFEKNKSQTLNKYPRNKWINNIHIDSNGRYIMTFTKISSLKPIVTSSVVTGGKRKKKSHKAKLHKTKLHKTKSRKTKSRKTR